MKLRIAQIGTRHGHAQGKWRALCTNGDVEAVGIWEPDLAVRAAAQAKGGFAGARWFDSAAEAYADPSVAALAIEGRNHESLAMAQAGAEAGKHLWYDKPAGDDWPAFERLLESASATGSQIQMGYMFRYSPGFVRIGEWVQSGVLGDVFAIRAHMSTSVDLAERTEQSRHRGGILYDLGGHMIDQIVSLLGRPTRISTVLRNDATPELPGYADNTAAVFEFPSGLAVLDIAAMEPRPAARRFEVYGARGSAIVEPFDPPRTLRLALNAESGEYASGEHVLELPPVSRQEFYDRELAAFLGAVRDQRPADRSIAHERLVQETLLRATGSLAEPESLGAAG